MNVKYCMQCGGRNSVEANFCQKCATSFNATASNRTPPSSPIKITDEPEHLVPKKSKRGRVEPQVTPESELVKLPSATTESSGSEEAELEETELEEGKEGDGISLNFVPNVAQLEIESISTDVVKKISFGEMVAQANREKEVAKTPQP